MHNDTSSEAAWFYAENGERHGTLDEAQMIELIHAGRLDQHTPVWKTGDSDWRLLGETELCVHLRDRSHAAADGRRHDNRLTWLLVCAPLLGYLLEWLLALAFSSSPQQVQRAMAESSYWYATLGLSILLGLLDEQRLRQAGHDTRRLRRWVCLAPAYLHQRSRQLQQPRHHLVAWLAACGLRLLA